MTDPTQLPGTAPLWTVGVPKQTKIADPQRGYIDGWDVPIIMSDKSTFIISIPADSFTPETVQAAIEDHVNRIVAIRTLTGPTY